ncbi:MAG: MerR family transcriptional regulator [Oscillospiraceae bacterium]|nr:MerR family transcriptional regulator [Oscillospiraceae bacterium]
MNKELYTIKEFADLTGVEVSKLRFYDKIGLFSPSIRNPENNYRYYSPTQVMTLNFITVLSDLNLPLKTIAGLREERSPVEILKLLAKQEKQLSIEMLALQKRHAIISARRELINYGVTVANGFKTVRGKRVSDEDAPENAVKGGEDTISVLQREDKEYILWPRNEYSENDTFLQPLLSFVNRAKDINIDLDFPVGGYWGSMENFMSEPSRPEHFFSIDPHGTNVRKEGNYLIGFTRGYYGQMGDLPERMSAYVKEKDLTVSGPVWVMYMFDEICTKKPEQFLAQACVAVSKFKRSAGTASDKKRLSHY